MTELRTFIPPGYWMHETGVELKPAVMTYLEDPAALTLRQIVVLKGYLFQWISSGVWDTNPEHDDASRARLRELRESAGRIVTVADIHAWLFAALDEGIDPL